MRWFILLVLLFINTPVLACGGCGEDPFLKHVSLTNPAKYKLVYTGIAGLLLDEYVKFVSRKWRRDITFYQGFDSNFDLLDKHREVDTAIEFYKRDHYADLRTHWWQYSSDWGPLPRYTSGPSGDVINIGPFRLNNKFKFKIKHYETNITDKWHFKFRPSVSFTGDVPFVRALSARFVFTYKDHGKKLITVTLSGGLNTIKGSGELMLFLELPSWGR